MRWNMENFALEMVIDLQAKVVNALVKAVNA